MTEQNRTKDETGYEAEATYGGEMNQDADIGDADAPEAADVGSPEQMAAELAKAREQAEENWAMYLRARAELDNVRRRTERDMENMRRYALEKFVAELLAVRDSMEMGVEAAADGKGNLEALRDGVELTYRQFMGVLEKFGVREINPLGEPFDPDWHEAVSAQPSEDAEPDTVVAVMQKGYAINDRLVRPARVIVAKAADG